ncbi:hypothetical protein ACWEOI_27765 [Nocardia sp. NPDC004340]
MSASTAGSPRPGCCRTRPSSSTTAGAAIQLRAGDIDPGAVADRAARLLSRRGNEHRDAAAAIAAEIATMPDPEAVVGALRAHVTGR